MFKIKSKELELNIIPCIMALLSIIIAFVGLEVIRKVLLLTNVFLSGIQIKKVIYFIKNKKGE